VNVGLAINIREGKARTVMIPMGLKHQDVRFPRGVHHDQPKQANTT
jgi:hypothetical protein